MINTLMEIEQGVLPCEHSKLFYVSLNEMLISPNPAFISIGKQVLLLEKGPVLTRPSTENYNNIWR